MYVANSHGTVLPGTGGRNGGCASPPSPEVRHSWRLALAGVNRRDAVSLAGRMITALALAVGIWVGVMLAAATVGRLVLELVQWVGVLVLAVLGSGARVQMLVLPHALAQLTSVWPAFHVGQLARDAVGPGGIDLLPRVAGIAGAAALFFLAARRALRDVR